MNNNKIYVIIFVIFNFYINIIKCQNSDFYYFCLIFNNFRLLNNGTINSNINKISTCNYSYPVTNICYNNNNIKFNENFRITSLNFNNNNIYGIFFFFNY